MRKIPGDNLLAKGYIRFKNYFMGCVYKKLRNVSPGIEMYLGYNIFNSKRGAKQLSRVFPAGCTRVCSSVGLLLVATTPPAEGSGPQS